MYGNASELYVLALVFLRKVTIIVNGTSWKLIKWNTYLCIYLKCLFLPVLYLSSQREDLAKICTLTLSGCLRATIYGLMFYAFGAVVVGVFGIVVVSPPD